MQTLNYETWSAENLVTGFDDTFGFTVELERLTRHIHGETEEIEAESDVCLPARGRRLEGGPSSRWTV